MRAGRGTQDIRVRIGAERGPFQFWVPTLRRVYDDPSFFVERWDGVGQWSVACC